MKCRDLNKIDTSRCNVKPHTKYNKVKKIIGLDTETEKGEVFVLGYYTNDSKDILVSNNADEILTYLTKKIFLNSFNFFYNMTYDFQAILKTLPYKNIAEIAKRDKTIYKNWIIKTLPNKMFSVQRINKKHASKFYDLAQYFNHIRLEDVGKDYLGFGKIDLIDFGIDIKNLKYETYKSDIKYKQIINKYLFRDCQITYDGANLIYDMVKPYFNPKYFYSQASFSQQYYLESIDKPLLLPHKRYLQFGLNSYQGGRFEVIKRGYFKKANVYDIKSAYPHHNIQVPELTQGKWKEDNNYRSDSLVSLYKIDTEIYDTIISPMKYQAKDNLLMYPNGKFKDIYINKKEYEVIDKMGYNIKIKKAYHYFDNDPFYPYLFLQKFYDLKEKYKKEGKELLSWIPKIIINGFYGKLIQVIKEKYYSKDEIADSLEFLEDIIELDDGTLIYEYYKYKAGILFNPIVANEITANTRCQLLNACNKNFKDVIGFQTDSIITEKKLNLKFSGKLGDWSKEKEDKELITIGSGVYQFLDGTMIKVRGFQKNLNIYDIFKNNPNLISKEVDVRRNYKLKKTVKMKLHPKDKHIMNESEKMGLFNLIIEEKKTININFDRKRIWDRNFKNFNDVLNNQINSKPIIV